MTSRSARELLLQEALAVGPDVTFLEGIRGHAAVLESSENGPARIVRVSRGGDEVCWAFSLSAGEERPQFYPDDLPFYAALPVAVSWDDGAGLVASWTAPVTPELRTQIKERMTHLEGVELPEGMRGMAEELKGKSRTEMVEFMRERRDDMVGMMRDLPAEHPMSIAIATGVLGDLFGGETPAEVSTLVSQATAFHEERGWGVQTEETGGRALVKATLRQADRVRHLVAIGVMGIVRVALTEEPAGGSVDA